MSNIKAFFVGAAALGILYGLGFLLMPGTLLGLYGLQGTAAVLVGFRFFGVALLGLGAVFWVLRQCTDVALLRAILMGHIVSNAAGVLVALQAVLGGTTNALGWSTVLIYLLLTASDAYFLARLPATSRLAI